MPAFATNATDKFVKSPRKWPKDDKKIVLALVFILPSRPTSLGEVSRLGPSRVSVADYVVFNIYFSSIIRLDG